MQRMSRLFSQTLRAAPTEIDSAGYAYLLRAGFIRPMASGIFSLLPLGKRSISKIESVLREEMNSIGGQEVCMPVIQPADLWKETGRWFSIGDELGRFKDKNQRDMVLAMTHEEAVADLVRNEIRSYKQLPALIYHLQTKWRDDPRPRAGLIRVREFTMLDSYSLDADWDGLEKAYQQHYDAYFRIFERLGLPVIAVKSDTGMMGGKIAHEFMYLNPIGEDTLMLCDKCGYAANRQVATFRKPVPPKLDTPDMEEVSTPHASTIAELAEFLNIPTEATAKAVFFATPSSSGEMPGIVFAIVRGDMEVNETKLANLTGASEFRPATDDEIKRVGAIPGYASPVGVKKRSDLAVVVDDLIAASSGLTAGANREGYHIRNVLYGRDYQADIVGDISAAREGDSCPECGASLKAVRAIEVANIFQLGTRYSDALNCTFTDEQGKLNPVIMGSYGIGVGRLLGCLAENCHDDRGLALPVNVAPYSVHMVVLSSKNMDVMGQAVEIAQNIEKTGMDVLLDDRVESAGVKFNDADLIGAPYRVTVSERTLSQNAVELKGRMDPSPRVVPLMDLVYEFHQHKM